MCQHMPTVFLRDSQTIQASSKQNTQLCKYGRFSMSVLVPSVKLRATISPEPKKLIASVLTAFALTATTFLKQWGVYTTTAPVGSCVHL